MIYSGRFVGASSSDAELCGVSDAERVAREADALAYRAATGFGTPRSTFTSTGAGAGAGVGADVETGYSPHALDLRGGLVVHFCGNEPAVLERAARL